MITVLLASWTLVAIIFFCALALAASRQIPQVEHQQFTPAEAEKTEGELDCAKKALV
jgi:hypothetical protein